MERIDIRAPDDYMEFGRETSESTKMINRLVLEKDRLILEIRVAGILNRRLRDKMALYRSYSMISSTLLFCMAALFWLQYTHR
jgi:hypothetical protein